MKSSVSSCVLLDYSMCRSTMVPSTSMILRSLFLNYILLIRRKWGYRQITLLLGFVCEVNNLLYNLSHSRQTGTRVWLLRHSVAAHYTVAIQTLIFRSTQTLNYCTVKPRENSSGTAIRSSFNWVFSYPQVIIKIVTLKFSNWTYVFAYST